VSRFRAKSTRRGVASKGRERRAPSPGGSVPRGRGPGPARLQETQNAPGLDTRRNWTRATGAPPSSPRRRPSRPTPPTGLLWYTGNIKGGTVNSVPFSLRSFHDPNSPHTWIYVGPDRGKQIPFPISPCARVARRRAGPLPHQQRRGDTLGPVGREGRRVRVRPGGVPALCLPSWTGRLPDDRQLPSRGKRLAADPHEVGPT